MSDESVSHYDGCEREHIECALARLAEARVHVTALRDAAFALLVAADHVGSNVFDWERILPERSGTMRKLLNEASKPNTEVQP